ncbi:MAG: symmetrical bis(5'-nucleosyl)-tetraphosphatase [Gammaproteobacteria bacterium]|jgi:bis(5'-nucleosyl)-tetraphosphatase (symmetrical)
MATYAIGDVQGCYDELQALLDQVKFDFRHDTLWLAGDLVNRGPRSLEVLRFIKSLGECAVTVLGNHDLHLLVRAHGYEPAKKGDTLDTILDAPDRDELLAWLRQRPLMHHDPHRQISLIHAGLAPQWTLQDAIACAREAEQVLSNDDRFHEFLEHMYGNNPDHWDHHLQHWDRMRFIINCFTRLRYVDNRGRLKLKAKGAPGSQPPDCMPWFLAPQRQSKNDRLLFGHWSTLGFYCGDNVVALDTGCLWGGKLTAVNVDEVIALGKVEPVSINCKQAQKPELR